MYPFDHLRPGLRTHVKQPKGGFTAILLLFLHTYVEFVSVNVFPMQQVKNGL